jgi:UDP-glucose 4-epimerase
MSKTLLVTGATGKVGRAFTRALLADPRFSDFRVRALCHNRTLDPTDRLEVVRGSIEHREVVEEAVGGVTHALHLATCKEMPQTIMDVAVTPPGWTTPRPGSSWVGGPPTT